MNSERIDLKLYGVVTEILKDGNISVCEPIFTNYWKTTEKKFYRLLTENVEMYEGVYYTYPKSLEEIDISQFGTPLFLPASRKKINNGHKYLIIYQKTKNATLDTHRTYFDIPAIFNISPEYFSNRDYTPMNLTVGIKFPDKFIAVNKKYRSLSAEELQNFIK